MKYFEHVLSFEPKIEPNFNTFVMMYQHSAVKIYIPKKKNKPCVDKGCRWYVYFYFKDPKIHTNKKYKYYVDINRIPTVKERLKAAKTLQKVLETRLSQGYIPPDIETGLFNNLPKDAKAALLFAQAEKIKIWAESTKRNNTAVIKVFLDWLDDNNLSHLNIRFITKRHISMFLSYMISIRKNNNISRNNYRRILSSLFKELVVNEYIDTNFIENIPKLEEKPVKNKPFTMAELLKIRKWLLKNDPYLHKYLQFVTYAFLRPVEVCRIKIGDIDLDNRRIFIKTKTEVLGIIRIIDNLKTVIDTFNISKYDKNYYLFSPKMVPDAWLDSFEKTRTSFFIRRFKKVKEHFNFGDEYGIYSFRHSFALDLYTNFINNGLTDLEAKQKLMTITRHRSLSGLNNYLRNIGAFVPKDYSDNYSIKF